MVERSVTYQFRGEFQNLRAGLTAAGSSVQDFGKKLTALDRDGARMRAGLTTIGSAAGKMGLVAAGGLAAMAKSAADWESAWVGVQKTTDGTAAQMAKLEGELRGLAKTLPASHKEIAAVAEAAGQLGIQRSAVAGFTETMLQLGETTSMSAEDAAISIARFANVMQTPQDQIDRVGASVVELGNNLATTEGEIVVLGQRMAAAGAIAGLSESDVLGFAAALSSVGVEAEAGGTAMSKVFTTMRDAVIDGDEKLQTFATTAGMTAQDFAQQWGESPAQAINAFIQGLGAMNEQGESTSAVFKALGLTDQRLMRALLSTASAGDVLTDSLKMSGEAWQENTALTDEFAKFLGTTSAQVRVSMNNIRDAAIDAGAALLPMVEGAASGISTLANALQGLPGPVKSAATGLAGITAITGGALWFGSKVINGIASTKGALADLGIQAGRTRGALSTLGKGVSFAGLIVGLNAVEDAIDSAFGQNIDESNLSRQINAMARGEDVEALGQLAGAFNKLDVAVFKMIDTASGWVPDWVPGIGETDIEKAREEIEKFDQALAGMVETGDTAAASGAVEVLRARLSDMGVDANLVTKELDDYALALRNAGELTGGIGGAMGALINPLSLVGGEVHATAAGLDDLGDSADGAESEVKSLSEALDALLSPMMDQDAATVAWKRSIQSLTEELEGGSDALDRNTKRGQDNRDAIRDRVTALAGMIAADEAAGVEAEVMQRKMRRGAAAIMDAATAAGIGEGEMRGYLRQLGLTPKQIKTLIQNNAPEAKGKVDDLNNALDRIPRNVQTTINVALSGLNSAMSSLGALNPLRGIREARGGVLDFYANGGMRENHVAQIAPAGAYRVWAEEETGGEAYIPLAASKRDRSLDIWAETGRRLGVEGFAAGGIRGARYSLDERREILRLEQSIRELTKSLNATGKEALKPGERAAATLDRLIARRDLRQARNEPARLAREAQIERLGARRDVFRDRRADLRGGLGDLSSLRADMLRPDGIVGETQQALQAFKRSITDAGGTWTNRAKKMSADMMSNARAIEANERAIDAETARRDTLADALAEHQASLNELRQTMDQLSSQVAGNFLSNPFNASLSAIAGAGGAAGPSPELLAAQDALSAAKGRYHSALSADGDPLQRSYLASKALAEVDQYQAQVDALSRDLGGVGSAAEQAVTGLAAFDQILAENTAAAKEFAETLTALAKAGLDGPLYEMLAASGDLGLARELLASGPGGIDARERAWAERDRVTAELGALVASEVYGEQYAAQMAAVEAQTAILESSDARLAALVSQAAANDARRDALIQTQTSVLANQIQGLQDQMAFLARQQQNVSQQIAATKKGRK